MKRFLSGLISILLLLSLLPGCGDEESQGPVTYAKPTLTPGVLESDLLKAEPGNFDRINDTGLGDYLENETGYYVNWHDRLHYAEKTDLNTWYYVCNEPDCAHNMGCSAFIMSNSVWYSDGNIYFSADTTPWPQFKEDGVGYVALMHMKENGTDITLDHGFNYFPNGGYQTSHEVIPGGSIFGARAMRPDGKYDSVVYLYTLEGGLQTIFEETVEGDLGSVETKSGLHMLRLGGDLTILSRVFRENNYENNLCWFHNGEPVFTDISEVPAWGGYLKDGVLRCFYPGDGYYDVDLISGERTKLANAQLDNSKARILQPNCIIETTLLNPEAVVETQEMRFFDGQQWHTVTLPEDLRTPDNTFQVVALASDRILFYTWRNNGTSSSSLSITFYQLMLDTGEYRVEYMGTFRKPYNQSTGEMIS